MAGPSLTLPDGFLSELVAAHREHLAGSTVTWWPSEAQFRAALDAAFWASLKLEEGRVADFTVTLRQSLDADGIAKLADAAPLTSELLHRLACATAPLCSALAVGPIDGRDSEAPLFVLGLDAQVSPVAAVARLEIRGPGSIAIKSANDASLAYLEQEELSLIDLELYGQFYGFDPWRERGTRPEFKRLRRFYDCWTTLRAHRHGGAILVVDDGDLRHLRGGFRLAAPFKRIAQAEEEIYALRKEGHDARWTEVTRRRFAELIGRTTGIDGAAVLDADAALIAFGAKIARLDRPARLERRRPVRGSIYEDFEIEKLGGMRHQSAAAFVALDPKHRAIVASQDGRLSMFVSKEKGHVACLEHADWLL